MRTLFAMLMILSLTLVAFAQESKPPEPDQSTRLENSITKSQLLKLPRRDRKPSIRLQRALKIAESFIKKEKLNFSSCYLFEARLIFNESGAESHWQLWWVSIDREAGDDIKVTVSMGGNPQVLSSP